MFDCPKHMKIQKLVLWERQFTLKQSHPANTSICHFILMIFRFDLLFESGRPNCDGKGHQRRQAVASHNPQSMNLASVRVGAVHLDSCGSRHLRGKVPAGLGAIAILPGHQWQPE
jgi:hypothetical protein